MFCSVIIPTVGRPTVSRAVRSVLDQEFSQDGFEVIVVNDSGRPLPAAEWQESARVRVVHTNRHERSIARNTGAAIALGEYLCFLDDDDWLLSGALEHIWALARKDSDAVWLYGGLRVADETGRCLVELNSGLCGNRFAQIMGGAWAPMQASFVRTGMFFAVGGYNPAICGTEDLDLCRRVALHGDLANTAATVACLFRGRSWDTSTDYGRAPEDIRYSRDRVLSEPGAFTRMRRSADSGYWYGRIFRVYLSTVRFNLRHRRPSTAISRAVSSMAWFAVSRRHVFSRGFWDGARAHHVPGGPGSDLMAAAHAASSAPRPS
jgi:glycosyltransferase involved in cell wall biosynthesis